MGTRTALARLPRRLLGGGAIRSARLLRRLRGEARICSRSLLVVAALALCACQQRPPRKEGEPTKREASKAAIKNDAIPADIVCVEDANKSIASGKLERCKLERALRRGKIACGAGTMAGFYRSGGLKYCWLTAATELDGSSCQAEVTLYPSGKLRRCQLAADREAAGVALKAEDWVTFHESGAPLRVERSSSRMHGALECKGETFFHDDGKLKRCTLARPATLEGKKLPADELVCLDREGKPTGCTSVLADVSSPPG